MKNTYGIVMILALILTIAQLRSPLGPAEQIIACVGIFIFLIAYLGSRSNKSKTELPVVKKGLNSLTIIALIGFLIVIICGLILFFSVR
jgi:hypothetical protein